MMGKRSFLVFSLLLLASCATPIETRVFSSGSESPPPRQYTLIELPKNSSADLKQLRGMIVKALEAKGISQAEDADALLNITVSQRPAETALKSGDRIISSGSEKKSKRGCDNNEYRMTIQMTRASDGEKLYAGEVAEYHCELSLQQAMPSMVNVLISDMDAPRGTKLLKRED